MYLGRFHVLTVYAFFETAPFKNRLIKIFTVCNFGNTLAMTIIFFSKCLKFDVDSRKNLRKRFSFFR